VNQYCYIDTLRRYVRLFIGKDPKFDPASHDKAPAHSALGVRKLLAKYLINKLRHMPNSPDLAPCDFCLVPKLKIALKRVQNFRQS